MKQLGTLHGLPVLMESSPRRRSTITIYVRPEHILIRVPQKTPVDTVQSILKERLPWIEKQVSHLASSPMAPSWPRDAIFLRGQLHKIEFRHGLSSEYHIWVQNQTVYIEGPALTMADSAVREQLIEWLRRLAADEIAALVKEWSLRLHAEFHTIRFKELKSRWGSCSSKGNLNFNWRLILAPQEVCEYVVVHELCHLREMNHSNRFWTLVKDAFPNYLEAKQWLKNHGSQLYF